MYLLVLARYKFITSRQYRRYKVIANDVDRTSEKQVIDEKIVSFRFIASVYKSF